jgi:D-alanyl-D-alanine carboxypeptidase/D-alanyl-D-alanine-endopeptidase (penicillin-binding protein 4)
LLLAGTTCGSAADSQPASGPASTATFEVPLVWHVESTGGEPLGSRDADRAINPASVVKVATTLWALDRLGPAHRFVTTFGTRGTIDAEAGVLRGDLIVPGSGDPDFHVENAYLVARALNALGVRRVSGALLVGDPFWVGWEGGSERTSRDRELRAGLMASRLRDSLDSKRWTASTRRALREFAERRGFDLDRAASVVVEGDVGRFDGADSDVRALVVHRSNPLVVILKRFNSWSNNDIERLGLTLGDGGGLAAFLSDRWGETEPAIRFETLSGLGANRMSTRQVVHLLRDLRATCGELGISVQDLLPVGGCDPGTLNNFPNLRDSGVARALVAKTGTLVKTDGGVAALAGYVETTDGELLFSVVAPGAGSRLTTARGEQERWLLDLVAAHEGAAARECGAPPPHSDADASAESPATTARTL